MPFEFLEKFGSRPGLERVSALLADWGDPQEKMKVVLVGGTNGKGSTTAFLSSILQASGKKVGSFYSPHLFRFNERIRINGKEISDADVLRLEAEVEKWVKGGEWKEGVAEGVEEVGGKENAEGAGEKSGDAKTGAGEAGEGRVITYFEAVAACAYRHFAENEVEYAVMEVGMGGRLDAVNVAREEIAIVSSVGLEHTKWLGSEIDSVAFEKAGIMKKGLGITGASLGLEKIKSEARKRNLNLLVYGEDFEADVKEEGMGGTVFNYSGGRGISGLRIGMAGRFQVRNACLAVCAAESLGIGENAIREGLLNAQIRGRMEVLSKEPLVVADIAHNPPGIKALVDSLDLFGERKIVCVFSCMKDKEYGEMLKVLGEKASVFVFCKPAENARAEEPEALLEAGKEYTESYTSKSVGEAVSFAKGILKGDGMVLITGSIYMMGEAYGAVEEASP